MTMCSETSVHESASAPVDRDMATAAHFQRMLLPPLPFVAHGWSAEHRFAPAGPISGDFVDLVPFRDRVYFMLGDASGKRRSCVARHGAAARDIPDAHFVRSVDGRSQDAREPFAVLQQLAGAIRHAPQDLNLVSLEHVDHPFPRRRTTFRRSAR
jgi:hypothetical protein